MLGREFQELDPATMKEYFQVQMVWRGTSTLGFFPNPTSFVIIDNEFEGCY